MWKKILTVSVLGLGAGLVSLRRKINGDVRSDTLEFLTKKGYKIVPGSQANFFMVDVKRPGSDPFHVPPDMVPHSRKYQWWHLVHDKVHFARAVGAGRGAPVIDLGLKAPGGCRGVGKHGRWQERQALRSTRG
jgi:hypothetical protein